jgi:hypothetical protein
MVLADGAAQEQSRVWPVLRAVLWVFVLSRVFFFEVASLAYIYLPHAWVEAPEGTLPPPGGLLYHVLAGLWVHWDGLWYLSIARYGYVNRPTATAFFPLYPFAMHVLGDSTVVGGIVISLVAYAVALYFLAKLVTMECGPRVAWMTLLALAFFPTAFYNNAVYSESLFLMFALGSLYFLRTRRYGWGGLFGALATLVSVYGLFLAVPYAWQIWRQEGLRWRKLLHVLWMPAGLMAYMAYLTPLFGDPLIFQKAQSNWGRHFEPLVVTLWQGWHAALKAAPLVVRPAILFAQGQPSSLPANFFNFVFALFALVVAIGSVRRLPFYLWAYMACALLLPLSYPAQGQPLMSMPRLLLEAFPLFIGLGDMMARTRWVRATYFVLAIPLGMLLVSLFATAHWVA